MPSVPQLAIVVDSSRGSIYRDARRGDSLGRRRGGKIARRSLVTRRAVVCYARHVRRARIAATALTAAAAIVWLGIALAGDPAPPEPASPPYPNPTIAAAVRAGKHVRIEAPRGPIHVWIPPGFRPDTGATVVYVHGYYDDADTAWTGHQLPEQFALSALNAMFVVPEAPVARGTPVNYPDLAEVIRLAEDRTGVTRGAALTAAIGHSGAYRTLEAWLDEPLLDHITMVDAMYGDEEAFATWLRASSRRRLVTVGEDTVLGTESFATKFPGQTYTMDRFPPAFELWPERARHAKHLYLRAQYSHMALVRDGLVLPALLRLLPVERLPALPWQLPLGSIPPLPDAAVDAPVD
jgi:hypothetical protein